MQHFQELAFEVFTLQSLSLFWGEVIGNSKGNTCTRLPGAPRIPEQRQVSQYGTNLESAAFIITLLKFILN